MVRLGVILILWAGVGGAQTAPRSMPDSTHPTKSTDESKKSGEVTAVNPRDGLTRDQGDTILNELKAIHQLLLNQQNSAAKPASAVALGSERVQMKMTSGWYSIGREDAPVTMIEFTDYQCPFCRKYHVESFGELKKNYIDTGKVRFISRDLPLDFHPYAQKAAEAARCAGDQEKYWELRDRMISNVDLSPDAILKMAQTDSLNMTSFRACLDGEKHKVEIQKDAADAGALGINGTPSFVIGRISKDMLDGDRMVGAVPISVFDTEIKKFLPSIP